MKSCFATVLMIGCIFAATTSQAQSRPTSNSLLLQCRAAIQAMDTGSTQSYIEAWKCSSYLAGFRDAISIPAADNAICIPPAVSGGQLVRVFVQWTESNAALLHEDQALGVVRALRQAFPCPGT